MKRLLFLVPVVLFAGLAVLFYNGLLRPPPDVLPSVMIGKPAPDFSLSPLDEKTPGFNRADLAGHASIVNFWASWCGPCRIEHPMLKALAANEAISLYGIDVKDDPAKARAYLDELGNPFRRIAADKDGRASIDWGVTGYPETFVVDKNGIIRFHISGPLTPALLEDRVLPLLAQ